MNIVIELTAARDRQRAEIDEDYFGGCPICKALPTIRNVHKSHIAACDQHRVRWTVGWNHLSSWQHEDVQTWRDNAALLEGYREVEPYFFRRKRRRTSAPPDNSKLPF